MLKKIYQSNFYYALICIGDVILTIAVAFLLRTLLFMIAPFDGSFPHLYITYCLVIVAVSYAYEIYTRTLRRLGETALSTVISVLVSTVVVVLVNITFSWGDLNVAYLLLTTFTLCVVLSAFHVLLMMGLRKVDGARRLLVLETRGSTYRLAKKLKYSYNEMRHAWYMIIDEENAEEIEKVIEEDFPHYDGVFISPFISEDLRLKLFSRAVSLGKEVYILPTLLNVNVLGSNIVQFSDTPVIKAKPLCLSRSQMFAKRVFDICVSLIAMIISSPIMLACAVAIKLDSKGPVIYKQERMTIHRKKFMVWKFRTMRSDAEALTGAVLATEDDPRITKVGKVLRSLRLDELPQFFNILFGSMSVVGPRPERPVFVSEYISMVRDYDKRFFVKAGLTGYAQVYGKYSTKVSDKVLLDIIYVNQYSFWMDIKMILLTIKIMFIHESSQGVVDEDYSAKEVVLFEREKYEDEIKI